MTKQDLVWTANNLGSPSFLAQIGGLLSLSGDFLIAILCAAVFVGAVT